jgi:hypothetical protein
LTWSPEGKKGRGRRGKKLRSEVERVLKQNNLTTEEAVNRQIWGKATEDE